MESSNQSYYDRGMTYHTFVLFCKDVILKKINVLAMEGRACEIVPFVEYFSADV